MTLSLSAISVFLLVLSVHAGEEETSFDVILNELAEKGIEYVNETIAIEEQMRSNNLIRKKNWHEKLVSSLFQETRQTGPEARARLYVAKLLFDKYDIPKNKADEFLKGISLRGTVLGKSCESERVHPRNRAMESDCLLKLSDFYRNSDGSFNNKDNPTWGTPNLPFRRLLPPEYGDGVGSPRVSANNIALPSPRFLSTKIAENKDTLSGMYSMNMIQWGQFLAHDISQIVPTESVTRESIMCCKDNKPICGVNLHPDCFPIEVHENDKFFQQYNVRCLDFVRSECGLPGNCSLGVRQQINANTPYIDGSAIYGSNKLITATLRSFVGGKLRMSGSSDHPLLPVDEKSCTNKTSGVACYLAGDDRANIQVELTIMHTIWAREHNRIATGLAVINPTWDDETLFRETRRIVVAMIQHITFNEFLPFVLGGKTVGDAGLAVSWSGYTRRYDPTLEPSLSNAFSTAAFRFGHSLIEGTLRLYSDPKTIYKELPLHKTMLNPSAMTPKDDFLGLVRGMAFQQAQRIDTDFSAEIMNRLFQTNGKFGTDLFAINIQRGRDHGLPAYIKWRKFCNQTGDTLDTMENIPQWTRRILDEAYNGRVGDIDLYVGGMFESNFNGGIVGQTFNCIMLDTFRRLRNGDRFFYEEAGPQAFTSEQLSEIRRVILARIICDNTDVKIYTKWSLRNMNDHNAPINCTDNKPLNLQPWKM